MRINKTISFYRVVKFNLLLVTGLLAGSCLQAQDLHFSQFMQTPLLINPANTGFNPDHDFRVGINYRSQWASLPVPYKTVGAWGDVQLMRESIPNGWLAVGGMLLRDNAGSTLTSTKVYGSVAYHQELSDVSLLSVGFNVGWAFKTINTNGLKWESQWAGKFFDINAPSGETFARTSVNYPDIQVGINYAHFPSDNLYINGGASIMHVNAPRESFFELTNSGLDNRVKLRYNVFANASWKLNDKWILNPSAYYSTQAGSSEIVGGMLAQYNLSYEGGLQALAGAFYRYNDAIIPMVGVEAGGFRFIASYDATASSLTAFNRGRGGVEFSLVKTGLLGTSSPRSARCPSF